MKRWDANLILVINCVAPLRDKLGDLILKKHYSEERSIDGKYDNISGVEKNTVFEKHSRKATVDRDEGYRDIFYCQEKENPDAHFNSVDIINVLLEDGVLEPEKRGSIPKQLSLTRHINHLHSGDMQVCPFARHHAP